MDTSVNLDKVVVVGVDRNELSGVVAPNEQIMCQFRGHSKQEVEDFHKQYQAGSFIHHTIAGQNYEVVNFSLSGRFAMMLEQ